MGVITSLIRAGREKKAADEEHQLKAFTLASQSEDPALRQWGIESITQLGVKHAPTPEAKKQIPVLGKLAGVMGQLNPVPRAPALPAGAPPKFDQSRADQYQQQRALVEENRKLAVEKQTAQDLRAVQEIQQRNQWAAEEAQVAHIEAGPGTQEQKDEEIAAIRFPKTQLTGRGNWEPGEVTFPGTKVPPVQVEFNKTTGRYRSQGKDYMPPAGAMFKPTGTATPAPSARKQVTILENGKEVTLEQDREGKLYDPGGAPHEVVAGSRFVTPATRQTDTDKLASQLLLSGRATNRDDAQRQAADLLVKVQEAKLKAAQSRGTGIGGLMTPEELRVLAQWELAGGGKPSFGLGANNPNRTNYQRALSEELSGQGTGEAMATRAGLRGGAATLAKLMQAQGSVGAFERNARANIERAVKLSEQVGRTGSSLANEYLQWAQGKLTDYPVLANFRVAVDTAAKDYALVTTTATMSGVSTDSARAGAARLFNEHMPEGSLKAAAESMYQDMDNRINGLAAQIEQTRKGIAGGSKPSTSPKKPLEEIFKP